jgi:LysM repeat protein
MANQTEKQTATAARPTAPEAQDAPTDVHTVAKGETLDQIAAKHDVDAAHLQRINAIKRPDLIWPGQKLKTR